LVEYVSGYAEQKKAVKKSSENFNSIEPKGSMMARRFASNEIFLDNEVKTEIFNILELRVATI